MNPNKPVKNTQQKIPLPGFVLICGEPESSKLYASKSPFSPQPKKMKKNKRSNDSPSGWMENIMENNSLTIQSIQENREESDSYSVDECSLT